MCVFYSLAIDRWGKHRGEYVKILSDVDSTIALLSSIHVNNEHGYIQILLDTIFSTCDVRYDESSGIERVYKGVEV